MNKIIVDLEPPSPKLKLSSKLREKYNKICELDNTTPQNGVLSPNHHE
jgi:hypothetical protein